MSLHYLAKHESQNCVFFSHALYCVSVTTLLLEHVVDFVFFSDESVQCGVASQLAEWSRPCAKQCKEAWHRSWTPAALSASM